MKKSPKQLVIMTVLFVGIVSVACDGSNDTPTDPVVDDPVVETITDTFMGTLMLETTSCHTFSLGQTGDIDMTVTALEPLVTLTIGMGVGLADDAQETGCAQFAADGSVRLNDVLQTTAATTADHCVCVFDVGNIFADETVTYTVEVTHPV